MILFVLTPLPWERGRGEANVKGKVVNSISLIPEEL
jgi:hypothetical protein